MKKGKHSAIHGDHPCYFDAFFMSWRPFGGGYVKKKHGIRQEHRPLIIEYVKKITYAESVDDAEKSYKEMVSEFSGRYDNFVDYFDNNIWINRDCWCKALMQDLPTRGNFTQNFVEAQFRVLKDEILQRVKAYNVNHIVDILVNDLEKHFKDKLLRVSSGAFDGVYCDRFKGFKLDASTQVGDITVISLERSLYSVEASEETHLEFTRIHILCNGRRPRVLHLPSRKRWNTMQTSTSCCKEICPKNSEFFADVQCS